MRFLNGDRTTKLRRAAVALPVCLGLAGLAGCGALGGDSGDAEVTLRLGSIMSNGHPVMEHGVLRFVEQVENRSEGAIDIEVYPDGQLAAAGEGVEALDRGIIDLAGENAGYNPQEMPLNQVWSLPFGLSSEELLGVIWRALHEDTPMAKEMEDLGVIPLMAFSPPPNEFSSSDQPLTNLEALDGLRMRVPNSLARDIVSTAGASPVEMSSPETYEALDRGVLDGTFYYFSGWRDLSLDEVLGHATTNLDVSTSGLVFLAIGEDDWNALTDKQRTILYEAGRDATVEVQNALVEGEKSALQTLESSGAVETYKWPDRDVTELRKRMDSFLAEWVADADSAGFPGTEMLASIDRFRTDVESSGADGLPDYDPNSF